MDQATFLHEVKQGRAVLEQVLDALSDTQMLLPVLPGGWTAKDLLAHFEVWQRRTAKLFQILQAGETPEGVQEDTIDSFNARIFADNQSRALDDVRRGEHESYLLLLGLAESADEADLIDPTRFAWTENRPFIYWMDGNLQGHWNEHLDDLRALIQK